MKRTTEKIRRVMLAVAAVILVAGTMGFFGVASPRFAGAAEATPTTEQRETIRGLDVIYEESRDAGGTGIYANGLSASYNESKESAFAIFEYVLEKGSETPGIPSVQWGDGLYYGYNSISASAYPGHYAAQFVASANSVAFADPGQEGKRYFVILRRDVANQMIFTLDAATDPVFAYDQGNLVVSNGTKVSFPGRWSGWNGGTPLSTAYEHVPDTRMCGFNLGGGTATMTGLKCYDETGKNLGVVMSGFDFETTNLDAHEDDDYWMTGDPSDTVYEEPINYKYFSSAPNAPEELSGPFNVQDGQVASGFYSQYDSNFTDAEFGRDGCGLKGVTLRPEGSVLTLTRWAAWHRKTALRFGKTIDVDEIDSVTMRVWGDKLRRNNSVASHANIVLFNLENENTKLGEDSVLVNEFVPEAYTETAPSDFIDVTIPNEQLRKLADAEGKVNGFQLVMVNDATGFGFFCIDSIRINPVHSVTYEADGGTHENPQTWAVSDGTVSLLPAEKADYTFVGWYRDEAFEEAVTELSEELFAEGNLTLYAKFTKTEYTVSFTSNVDGLTIPELHVAWGEKIPAPEPPTVPNMTFVGWTLDGEPYTFGEMPKNNLIIRAVYEGEAFDLAVTQTEHLTLTVPETAKYGSDVEIAVRADSGYVVKSVTATAADGTSVSVLVDGDRYVFTMPAQNVTVTGTVTAQKYTITYANTDGVANSNAIEYSIESVVTFGEVTKEGYTFEGWYLDENFETAVTSTAGLTGNITVYAKFSKKGGCSSSAAGGGMGMAVLLLVLSAGLLMRRRNQSK